jgi:hypothetical protein
MKSIFSIFLIVTFSPSLYSQKNDYKILADSAISIKAKYEYDDYLELLNKPYKDHSDSSYIEVRKDYLQNIYLIDENNNPYFFDNRNSKIKFKTISIYDKRNRKILKKGEFGIKAWKIRSILKGNELSIYIPDYNIKSENDKRLSFTTSPDGSFGVIFKYFLAENKWKIIRNESVNYNERDIMQLTFDQIKKNLDSYKDRDIKKYMENVIFIGQNNKLIENSYSDIHKYLDGSISNQFDNTNLENITKKLGSNLEFWKITFWRINDFQYINIDSYNTVLGNDNKINTKKVENIVTAKYKYNFKNHKYDVIDFEFKNSFY